MSLDSRATTSIEVRTLEPAAGEDAQLLDHLSDLINFVYATTESGLWRTGATRTTPSELAELIRAREVVVATSADEIVGSVRLHDISDDVSEFGLLVAAPERRGTGIGRALLDFAEGSSRDRGLRVMQLELLLPRGWRHPEKEFLKAWYGRRGYRLSRIGTLDDAYPHLAPLLATPCDLVIYEKPL
jgi:GNAT superfamily N-acetyltransferase